MTPAQMARDAARVVDRLERAQLLRIVRLLRSVELDAIASLDALDFTDPGVAREIREMQARRVIAGSRAAQDLLSLGQADGPIAEEFRRGIQEAYADGLRSATAAAVDSGAITAAQAAAFGATVDTEFIAAVTESVLTTLRKVSVDGLRRLEDAIVRGALRGQGPRAAARLVRESVNLTRYEAERITRTVFMRANNEARDKIWADLKLDFLRFDATNDERTCDFCAARHGAVYERDSAPKLPLHPMCRCVLLPHFPDRVNDKVEAYYARTFAEMHEGRDRPASATAAGPFERMDGIPPPKPVSTMRSTA